MRRLFSEIESGSVTQAIALINVNSLSSRWAYEIPQKANCMVISNGRLYCEAGTKEKKKNNPSTGSTFFYFGNRVNRFVAEFGCFGNVFFTVDRKGVLIAENGAADEVQSV